MGKSAGVNVFSKAYCMAHTVKKFWHPDTYQPEEICVGTPDNDDADDLTQPGNNMCKGDSGGPLICPVNGKATLVGVTSFYSAAVLDPQNGITDACASPGAAHVYQSTYDYKDWILGIINA